MRLLLDIVLGIAVLITLHWTVFISVETGSSGIAVLGVFAVVYGAFAILFLIAALTAWRYPALRRRAYLVMALPFVALLLPYSIRLLAGGAVASDFWLKVLAVAILGGIGTAVVAPRQAVRVLPKRLFRSGIFNALILSLLAAAWCVLIGFVAWSFSDAGQEYVARTDRGSSGMAAAYAIVAAAVYAVALGIGSFLTSLMGWLGLIGGVDGARRQLHIAQLVAGLPGVVVAVPTLLWLMSQA